MHSMYFHQKSLALVLQESCAVNLFSSNSNKQSEHFYCAPCFHVVHRRIETQRMNFLLANSKQLWKIILFKKNALLMIIITMLSQRKAI